MSNIAIEADNLSKAYQLGEFSTGTISRDIERWWYRVRGKEDPFLKLGETNDRTTKGKSDIVWSLKDVNFKIEQGDAVGIIGRNGAGKSTLLKVLSRVTSPTTGSVKVKGRIASLLEVGTGFHPELTGRENIFLNGAILGMRKHEIKRKFDEIVDFAGVERYIDTPVKRYSSGMYVRLAFAVAAHLESEILIVDEVLAVGDAEFQNKCLGKMNDVSKGEGRTVLFVSHNMGSINTLCNSCIYMKNGQVEMTGEKTFVIDRYTNNLVAGSTPIHATSFAGPLADSICFNQFTINGVEFGTREMLIDGDKDLVFSFQYSLAKAFKYRLTFSIYQSGVRIFTTHDLDELTLPDNHKRITSTFRIPKKVLRPGIYQIGLGGHANIDMSEWFWNDDIGSFTILEKWVKEIESKNLGLINVDVTSARISNFSITQP